MEAKFGVEKTRTRRRADSDSGIYSFGSASSGLGRLSRHIVKNEKKFVAERCDHHDYRWTQGIMLDVRDSRHRLMGQYEDF